MRRIGVLSKQSISALESICASLSLITALDHVLTNQSSWDCQRGHVVNEDMEVSKGDDKLVDTTKKEEAVKRKEQKLANDAEEMK
ncbi:hypothetical protein Tco_1262154 [Tanacetum coccineum]